MSGFITSVSDSKHNSESVEGKHKKAHFSLDSFSLLLCHVRGSRTMFRRLFAKSFTGVVKAALPTEDRV